MANSNDEAASGLKVSTRSRPRVLVAKVGLDGHDRGAKVVARALRDAGMDVIYTGLHRTAEEIVHAAIQEDVDVIGVSVLSGAHMTHFARLFELLGAAGAADVVVIAGGIFPEQDVAELKAMGVAQVFTPGTSTEQIVAWLEDALNTSTR